MIEGYAADWNTDQIRDATQKVADRIDDVKKLLKAERYSVVYAGETRQLLDRFDKHLFVPLN